MKNCLCIIMLCAVLMVGGVVQAGVWEPNRDFTYVLRLSEPVELYTLTEADTTWQETLRRNLRATGHTLKTFVLSNHQCLLNEHERLRVYVDKDDPAILLVQAASTEGARRREFVVDLREKVIRAPWGGGDSQHPHPAGNFITVFTSGPRIVGVPVSAREEDSKSGTFVKVAPVFNGNMITWW